jgi:hypothetical protein
VPEFLNRLVFKRLKQVAFHDQHTRLWVLPVAVQQDSRRARGG